MSQFQERIGDGLVRIGAITQVQCQEVLDAQTKGDARLFGEIALSKGFINFDTLINYLKSTQKA